MPCELQVPENYSLVRFDEIDSTNAEALRQAEAGQNGPLWIVAKSQTQGRGRRGRKWITQPGNLFATLLLNWSGPTRRLSDLSFVAAIACADSLKKIVQNSAVKSQVRLKWPNDILLDDSKIGGILIETLNVDPKAKTTAVAIGIGINVAGHPAETLAYPTTDLAEKGIHIDAEKVFEILAQNFDDSFDMWQGGNQFAAIKQCWLEFGPSKGQKLQINTGTEVISGGFHGLDATGGLQIRKPDGVVQTILVGDILAPSECHHQVKI